MAMPSSSVKATYSLDLDTVRMLERMARKWNVSKSEALRRAIHLSSAAMPPESEAPLAAFDRLRASTTLREPQVRRWLEDIAAERKRGK
jgi:hypothetical protein